MSSDISRSSRSSFRDKVKKLTVSGFFLVLGAIAGLLMAPETLVRLRNFPDSLIAGLITAVVALVAVLVNNAVSRWNLRTQHQNDRRQKLADVLLQTRRDVYMEVATVIEEALASIVRLANPRLKDDEATAPFDAVSAKIGKVYVVASEETALGIASFMAEYEATSLKLRLARRPSVLANQLIEFHRSRMDRIREQVKELQSSLGPMTLGDAIDPGKNARHREVTDLLQRLDRNTKGWEQQVKQIRPLQMELYKTALDSFQRLRLLVVPVLASVRDEIGAPLNLENLQAAFSQVDKFTDQQLRDLFGVDADAAAEPPQEAT
ncbi:UNVERIFIED_ORG: DUF4482 domain-containing protein [Shinella sp. XGS7]|nr:DUF4482 domain-containing protein [Shinella sp. XGS7]